MIFYALQRQPDPAASSYLFSRLKGRGERLKIDLLSEKDFDLPTTITLRAYTMDRATQAVSFEEFCLSLYNDYAKGITEKGRQSYIQASLPTAVGDAAMPPSVAWELPIKQKNIISSFIWWLKSGGSSANAASPANVRAGLQSFYDYLDLLSNQNDLYKPLKDYILNANKMIGEGTLAVSPTRFEVPAPAALAADSAADAGRSAPTPTPGDDAQDDTPDASSDQNGSEPTSTPDSRPGDGKGR